MASEVDICNLGLAHIVDSATVSAIGPPDGSVQAEHCARFYPIARDALLELHDWNFATKRVSLASITNTLDGWSYAYLLPNGCIRPLAVLATGQTDDTDTEDFIVEADDSGNQVLYTDAETATLKYTARITDTTKFTPLFVTALGRLLASYLAGPITRDLKVAAGQLKQFYEIDLPLAKRGDARARQLNPYKDATPAAISARK